ncbi:MAG: glycosyltransferase family 1 protein [Betaproteobacteria bacterium]|nr:glycosyltransferase family 1 protein [Betaproteobacteria bacterium]
MKISLVTDAWRPQVNGVVNTLRHTIDGLSELGHEVQTITPEHFTTLPCPTYPDIRLSVFPYRGVVARLASFAPQAVHIATEGPLGLAARRHCLRRGLPFTTAYHTRFPEYVQARIRLPLALTYRWLRWFHDPARVVMVPTAVVHQDLSARGFTNLGMWSRGVDTKVFSPGPRDFLNTARPIHLYVGRVAVEKNLEAFLALDLPGSKWVVGEGPQLAALRRQYPFVHFAGVQPPARLAAYYRAADVFVFPSRTDTFGLVLLEAIACGTPVAAFPVTGPIDVLGDSRAGVLHEDLRQACLAAAQLNREGVRQHALGFSWQAATQQFLRHLARPSGGGGEPV